MIIKKLRLNNSAEILISELEVASSLIQRTVGLLKYSDLSDRQALWILKCNSIHTFFMRFSIDCIFVDKNLMIKKIYSNVQPWRITFPVLTAHSVFEVKAGFAQKWGLREGDSLHVES